jgi:hypothetical protein
VLSCRILGGGPVGAASNLGRLPAIAKPGERRALYLLSIGLTEGNPFFGAFDHNPFENRSVELGDALALSAFGEFTGSRRSPL